MPMLKLEISSEIKRPVEEVFAYLTDPVNRRELIDERSYDTAILLALGGGSLLGRLIVGFVVPFIYFVRWSLKNAASTKTKPRKDVSTLTNFALIPAAVFAIWLGYAGVGPLPHWLLWKGLTIFLRAGSHSVGLSHVRAFLFP